MESVNQKALPAFPRLMDEVSLLAPTAGTMVTQAEKADSRSAVAR